MRDTRVDLDALSKSLYTKTGGKLSVALNELSSMLFNTDYQVGLGGSIRTQGQVTKALPKNVARIIDIIQKAPQSGNYEAVRDEVISIGAGASQSPPSYCCGLFQPRNNATQRIYEAFAQAQAKNAGSLLKPL